MRRKARKDRRTRASLGSHARSPDATADVCSLLTVPLLPPPTDVDDRLIDRWRAKQFSACRLLRLPRELIDKITSYITTPTLRWALAAIKSPTIREIAAVTDLDVDQTADLTSLALTCRYLLAILHPSARVLFAGGAAAPWAGQSLCGPSFDEREPFDARDFYQKQYGTTRSAVTEVRERLREDKIQGRRKSPDELRASQRVEATFERDVIGKPTSGAPNSRGNTTSVLRNLTTKQYMRKEDVENMGYECGPCDFGQVTRSPAGYSIKYYPSHRFDIRNLSANELMGWTDVTLFTEFKPSKST